MRAARHLCAGTAFLLAVGTAAPAGAEVASGWRNDFDANGVADLVVGSPGDTDCGFEAGGFNLVPGSAAGLTADGNDRRVSCGFRDGYATGKLLEPVVGGHDCAGWARGYAQQHGIDLTRSTVYAAHGPDLLLLSAVGQPCVVNPDFTLRRAARQAEGSQGVPAARDLTPAPPR